MFLVPVSRQATRSSRSFDRLFDDTFERFFAAGAAPAQGTVRPALDVAETETHYTVTLDLPGVAKEDVKVSIDGKRVSIEAQAAVKEEAKAEGEAAAVKVDAPRVLYRERSVARYARSIVLPAEPEQAESSAKLENGVLTLTLTKKRTAQPSRIAVN
jgi:HSP20 family protein